MKKGQKTNLTFIADTHYYSPSLGTSGRSYELRSDSDQKCLKETGGIIDAAFSHIEKSDTQAVMIIGDLTNDGERVCHEEFRQKLYKLQKSKPVYVITATHDWCCDENPRMFDGQAVYHDVPTVAHDELRSFYYDFGPKQAKDEYVTHLGVCSYTVDIGKDVRLLALNDDQNGKGRAGFKEEHFCFIENEIKKAKADGKILIGMEHHLIIAHTNPLITGGGTCVGDREYVASRLADAGLKYMFTGHSHLQRIASFTSEKGNTITQINVGSLCGYPSPIVNVSVSEEGLEISTDCAKKFVHNGKAYDTKNYLASHAYKLIDKVLESADADKYEFRDRLTALQLDGEKFMPLYFMIKPVLKRIKKAKVKDVYKLLRLMHLSKNINERDALLMGEKPVLEIAYEIMLSAFDGSAVRHEKGSIYYNTVMPVFEMLSKLCPCKLTKDIKDTIYTLLVGDEYDINACTIK